MYLIVSVDCIGFDHSLLFLFFYIQLFSYFCCNMSINVQYSVSALINEIYRHAASRVIFVKEITSIWTWSRRIAVTSQSVRSCCMRRESLTESRLPLREFTVAVLFTWTYRRSRLTDRLGLYQRDM